MAPEVILFWSFFIYLGSCYYGGRWISSKTGVLDASRGGKLGVVVGLSAPILAVAMIACFGVGGLGLVVMGFFFLIFLGLFCYGGSRIVRVISLKAGSPIAASGGRLGAFVWVSIGVLFGLMTAFNLFSLLFTGHVSWRGTVYYEPSGPILFRICSDVIAAVMLGMVGLCPQLFLKEATPERRVIYEYLAAAVVLLIAIVWVCQRLVSG